MFKKYTASVLFFLYLMTPLSAMTGDGVEVIVENSPDTQSVVTDKEDTDSTPEIETDSTIDAVIEESDDIWRSWKVSGDFRPIFTSLNVDGRNVFQSNEGNLGFRGRLQTRFVLRGGVYAKSLDRNDSNNTRITWTDGLHATFRSEDIGNF